MADETNAKDGAKGAGAASWLKENPALAKVLLLVGLLVVLAVILAVTMLLPGENKPVRSPSASATAVPPSGPAAPTPPPTPPPAATGDQQPGQDATEPAAEEEEEQEEEEGEGEGEGEEEVPGQPSPPGGDPAPPGAPAAEPNRPEKISDWKMADYFSARAENDPRLIEAVGGLGERFAGSPKAGRVAEILAELLAPPNEEEEEEEQDQEDGQQKPPAASAPQPSRTAPSLIEAIVRALGDNGSETARKILEQLVAGTLPTENDKAAALAALGALSARPSAENEAILFRVLSAAEELRPEGRGEVTAEELRDKTLNLIQADASERLRTRLARYVVEPSTPGQLRATIGGLLEQGHPDNLGAQLVLYKNDDTPEETKTKLGEYFIAGSSQAMGLALGVTVDESGTSGPPPAEAPSNRPVTGDAGGTNSEPPDTDLPARQLWGASCVAMLEERLGKLDSLQGESQLVVLAATIPVGSIRSTVLETLQKHWQDGPGDLESAGLLQQTISDPGFLTVLKALCRRRATSRASSKEAQEEFQQTKEDWTKFSDDLLSAWCERFHAAAAARAEAGKSAAAGSSGSLPIKLHSDAKAAAEYHLAWPADVQAKLSGVATGTMEIHYVRIEEKARYKSRLGYYRRQLKARPVDVRQVENSDRVDSFRTVPQSDRRRSIDVLITRVEGRPAESSAQNPKDRKEADEAKADEELLIEILSIEIEDPTKS